MFKELTKPLNKFQEIKKTLCFNLLDRLFNQKTTDIGVKEEQQTLRTVKCYVRLIIVRKGTNKASYQQ